MTDDVLQKTKVYAEEDRLQSWMHVAVAFALVGLCGSLIVITQKLTFNAYQSIALSSMLSIILGLLVVRLFILFHDFHHQAILAKSTIARLIFWLYGMLTLTPPNAWRETHNFHHAHTSKLGFSNIGSFKIMTLAEWEKATPKEKQAYKIQRHPLTILFGYFTVFLLGLCIAGFVRKPTKNWDGLLAIGLNIIVLIAAIKWGYVQLYLFIWLFPVIIGSAVGTYIFYAQHNFPSMEVRPRKQWNYLAAALHSTCLINMPKWLHWFTGNIGYHHVHHANHKIPFYRLPEVMRLLSEFQEPKTTSLRPKDIYRCLQLSVWDMEKSQMLTYRDLVRRS
ncbi:MAG: omega-6 fatty acid desaturase (delta-12 desaturase) [Flavobacteriales bacterium]|jgi:omega-6 fatty acid desaturase (delta-12 desaturase)